MISRNLVTFLKSDSTKTETFRVLFKNFELNFAEEKFQLNAQLKDDNIVAQQSPFMDYMIKEIFFGEVKWKVFPRKPGLLNLFHIQFSRTKNLRSGESSFYDILEKNNKL
jgi:hypothetical protein